MTPIERSESSPSRNKGFVATLRASVLTNGIRAPKLALLTAVTLTALMAVAAPALAAAPEKPELKVEQIFATTATFKGVLSPKATEPNEGGTYQFVYRAAKPCKGAGEKVAPASPGLSLGQPAEPVNEPVSGLTPNTTYAVCLVVKNLKGETAVIPEAPFKTTAPVKPEAPECPEASDVSERKATSATLNCVLNPLKEGEPGHYRFLYSQSPSVCTGGIETPEEPASGSSPQPVSAAITGLEPGKPYTFCVKALNALGESTLSGPKTFETAIPPETPEKVELVEAKGTSLKVKGLLNPKAKGEAGTFEFLYKRSAAECEGEGSVSGTSTTAKGDVAEAEATALLPHTQYTFCLRATNDALEVSAPSTPPVTFTTLVGAPTIEQQWTTDVASTSATLHAALNPEGAETSYTFEYAPVGGAFIPVSESEGHGVIPEGVTGVPLSVHVQQGLTANTAYQFRLRVSNSAQKEVTVEPVTFTTQTVGGELGLPDSRSWEMVSPLDKHGAQIEPIAEQGITQAAIDGGAITYLANAPTEAEPPGNSNEVQVLSTRGSTGWGSRDIAIPHDTANGKSVGEGQEYRFFSEDLSRSVVQPFNSFIPELSAEASEATPYLREDFHGAVSNPCVSSCYRPLVTGAKGYENVPPGTIFGEQTGQASGVKFVGATSDSSHVVIKSVAALTPSANKNALYEWANGGLTLVSILPNGEPAGEPFFGDGNEGSARGAISTDGSRIIWRESGVGGGLYARDTVRSETVKLDAAEPACESKGECSSGQPQYQIASNDGSKIFFTDTGKLTRDAAAEGDLYECEMVVTAGALECKLSDLTPPSGSEAAAVQGSVLGVSEDGSWVYFVANGVLASGAAPGACAGEGAHPGATCNLYAWHDGATALVAVLSGADFHVWSKDPSWMPVRVTPNGEWLAFMSQRSLTGYDNLDAVNGTPDAEVYLYNAAGRSVICASCNPTGARPVGVEYSKLEPGSGGLVGGPRNIWESTAFVAANVPGWTSVANAIGSRYQPRYLSNSGRLFFNSNDPLVPRDVNGTEDVYQYEPPGVGSCTTSSVTFNPHSGGCVGLISSGTSAEESAFLDASENGGDVFFLTASKLAPQDLDTAFDVYDAHECSAASPCLPAPVVTPPPCSTGDSCKPAPSPQPDIFGSPASATFSGTGNVVPPAPASVKPKTAAQVRAEKLASALKVCRVRHNKHKRAVCESKARKLYGPSKAKRANWRAK